MEIPSDRVIEAQRGPNAGASRLNETQSSAAGAVSSRPDRTRYDNNKGVASHPDRDPLEFASSLLPPFMQTKRQKFSSVETSFPRRGSGETADHDVTRHAYSGRAKKITSLVGGAAAPRPRTKGATGEGKSSMSSRSEEVAGKSDVPRKDTKVTSDAICETLRELDRYETAEYPAEMGGRRGYLESPGDSDRRERSGDFHEDETDYQEWRNVQEDKEARTLARCESLLSSSESHLSEDQDLDTVDPLLAHESLVPYNHMPRPRLFRVVGKDDGEYIATALPRRPRSPARSILPGRFDLRAKTEELLRRQRIAQARRYLRKSKDRILQSVKQVRGPDVDFDLLICMLVLRAVCEQVILTTADANTGTDDRTFVNMAIIWALVDLRILDSDTLNERERAMFVEVGLYDADALPRYRETLETTVGTSELRRALFEARSREFGPRVAAARLLHRCLPWALVGPAHQRGDVVKLYPNARQRIDERLPPPSARSAYVPDLTCFHLREVPDKAYVAYKRKSKYLAAPRAIDRERDDELLVQFISFV